MKGVTITTLAISLLALNTLTTTASPTSSSGSYTLLPGEPGTGGGQVNGGTVAAEISVGDGIAGGVSTVTGSGFQTKGNFTGQLYDPVAIDVTGTPSSVNETLSTQLAANATMDDDTTLPLDPNDIAWSVMAGPFSGVTAGGLATSTSVYQNEVGMLRGIWQTLEDIENITVLNVGNDDFGSYAGDEIDDDWQVGFFGVGNPDAAPGIDVDGDDRDNLFEFLSGFSPIDGNSFFDVILEGFSAPGTLDIILNKVIPGRTYTLKANTDLNPTFLPVGSPFSVGAEELDKLLQDPTAGVRKFYKVDISKP